MSAYLTKIKQTPRNWGHLSQPIQEPQKTVEMVFADEILTISALGLNTWEDSELAPESIDACVKAISKDLEFFDFSLTHEARQKLLHHWKLFDTALQNEKSLDMWEPLRIRLEFRHACLTSIKNTWCADAAIHFYRILLLSDHGEKINKAQRWSEQFAAGVFYFNELARTSSTQPGHFYKSTLAITTQTEFKKCYMNVMNQKVEFLAKVAERDPASFAEKMASIDQKKKDSTPLSAEEQEIEACAKYGVSCCMHHFPDLEEQIKLLNSSMYSKYLQGNGTQRSFSDRLATQYV